jgi:hypothetical protein
MAMEQVSFKRAAYKSTIAREAIAAVRKTQRQYHKNI